MFRPASARRRKQQEGKLNLVPILDAVFIFIFFLLASSQFVKMYEVASDIPTVSDEPPPPDKPKKNPLNLKIKVTDSGVQVLHGLPQKVQATFAKKGKDYDFTSLHQYLVKLKNDFKEEKTVTFEPLRDLDYQIIINLMDAVRKFRFDDPELKLIDELGNETVVKELFSDIIFGNLE